MKNHLRLGLTLAGAYLLFLLVTIPAPLVLDSVRPRITPHALYGVSGSLWCGQAETFGYGALRATRLGWTVHPLALVLGRIETGWTLDDDALRGSGSLGRTLGGTLYLSGVKLEAALQALQSGGLLKIPLPIDGRADFALDRLRYSDGKLNAADGGIDIKGVATLVPALALGDFHIELQTQQAGIKAMLSDRGGPLRAEGVAMITPDGAYQFTGSFSARDPSQENLQQYLRMMGRMGPDGRVNVNYSGQL